MLFCNSQYPRHGVIWVVDVGILGSSFYTMLITVKSKVIDK